MHLLFPSMRLLKHTVAVTALQHLAFSAVFVLQLRVSTEAECDIEAPLCGQKPTSRPEPPQPRSACVLPALGRVDSRRFWQLH
jgi:hypothetical protein